MKTSLTLMEMAREIERQRETKRDFLAPERSLTFDVIEDHAGWRSEPAVARPVLQIPERGHFPLTAHAHGQVSSHLGIPKPYYDRMMAEAPQLLVRNLNHWLEKSPARRMVRTLDGHMRAYLSDRYRPLDNTDLAEAVLPILMDDPQIEVTSCAVTETRFYLKATTPRMTRDIKVGDPVQSGIVISNSEVGAGGLKVEPLLYRLVCLNGAIVNDASLKKHHVGGRLGDDDATQEFYRDETRRLDDAAFFSKVQDIVRGMWRDQELFGRIVSRWQEATQQPITGNLDTVVEVTGKQFGMTEDERGSVLRHLISGGDLSRYGLANAVTRMSQDVDDYDRATHWEHIGSSVIDLPQSQWKTIAAAK